MHVMAGRLNRVWLTGLALALFVGCPGTSKLVQVTGKILVDGQPADGAVVFFHPEATGESNIATGSADANGEFKLISNLEPGIAPGKYKVTAAWPDPAKRPSNEDIAMGRAKDAPDLLKGRYANKNRSQLTAEVTTATSELPALELKSK